MRMHKSFSLLAARLSISPFFDADALSPLGEVAVDHRHFNAREALVEAKSESGTLFLIKEGWACTHTRLDNGSSQVINFALPGDLVGLEAIAFPQVQTGVTAITPVNVMAFDLKHLNNVLDQHPRLTKQLLLFASCEFALLTERLTDFGRRPAYQRTLRFLLELDARLSQVGFARPDGFSFPVTQNLLADAVALTDVHLNRILRRFDMEGLLRVEHHPARYVRILDREAAMRVAVFEDAYLGNLAHRSKRTL